jgi:Ca2+-binding RTX toxin-like protein
VIFGGVGPDQFIFDGPGADTIYAGLGNDTVILVKDGGHDTVHCGPGDDDVFISPGNTVADDCEDIIHGGTPR